MIETLYKTSSPTTERSECFVLVLARRAGKQERYVFMEEHGYWDEKMERFIHRVTSIHADEELTYSEVHSMYADAKRRLAELGFIYVFLHDSSHNESACGSIV
jgi:hypothetical protein